MKPAFTHGGLMVIAVLCPASQAGEALPYKEAPGPWSDAAKPVAPRAPVAGEIPIDQPGCYAQEGAKYILAKDISSPMTPLFLGKDVVLDLNGHTVTFAAGGYQHVPNYGFEDGLAHWDVSKAPGAKAVSTPVRPLVGKKFCLLPAGQEIGSEAISLPVPNRSYYATCVLSRARGWEGRKISLCVEDEKGERIRCEFKGGSKPRVEGRIENQEALTRRRHHLHPPLLSPRRELPAAREGRRRRLRNRRVRHPARPGLWDRCRRRRGAIRDLRRHDEMVSLLLLRVDQEGHRTAGGNHTPSQGRGDGDDPERHRPIRLRAGGAELGHESAPPRTSGWCWRTSGCSIPV